jgi:hypothetical protein
MKHAKTPLVAKESESERIWATRYIEMYNKLLMMNDSIIH